MKKELFCDDWLFSKQNRETKVVDLPHDAMIEEKRTPDSPSGSAGAFFQGGKYVYEKKFFVSEELKEGHIYFQFEGVYKNSAIYINGTEADGKLLGFGSANPRTEEQYIDGSFTTYYGQAQAIIKAGKTGKVNVIVKGNGLKTARTQIAINSEN